jgi:hypothetical protein
MAAEVTPSRFGRQNATGTDYTNLFLKKFAGEVLTTFETENVFKPLHTVRTIESGKSAQFPVTGIATAKYHVPGDNMLLAANSYVNDIKHAEVVINIDSLLTSSTFVSRIDEAMNHYDVRSIYTTELGRALSKKFDKTLAKVAVLAARQSTTITGGFGGQSVTTGATPTGATLAAKIFEAAQKLDQQDIPAEDRVCVLAPAEYYTLLQSIAATSNANPVGSYIDGNVARVAGIMIVKSNNLPNGTNVTAADAGVNASSAASNLSGYIGNFTNTLGVVFHKAAIGTVKLLDLAVESEYKIELQGTFMVAKYAMGHGVLRPEAAVEIKTA